MLVLTLNGAVSAAAAAAIGVRLEGEGDGGRPIRARWDGVRGMSDTVSFAWALTRGSRASEKFRRRYRRRARRV